MNAATGTHSRINRFAVPIAVAAIGLLGACDPVDDAQARPGCADAVREASRAQEVNVQLALLDDAMLVCSTYDAFETELVRYPGSIGYAPETYIMLRCTRVDDEAVRESPSCRSLASPTTTVPPTSIASVVFVGETLDGRTVEIRPSDRTEFVGDVPAVVQQTVDIAVESGCSGLADQRDLWAGRVDDPVLGDEASVYAQHAQNVAEYIQCDLAPLATDAPSQPTEPAATESG